MTRVNSVEAQISTTATTMTTSRPAVPTIFGIRIFGSAWLGGARRCLAQAINAKAPTKTTRPDAAVMRAT